MAALSDDADLLTGLAGRIAPEARTRMGARMANGVLLLVADVPPPLRLVFTTRVHGGSAGEFATLNLSPRVGDDPAVVAANREHLSWALRSLEPDGSQVGLDLLSPIQEHGLTVMGASEWRLDGASLACDGLVLRPGRDRGLAPLLLFADCVPVVLVAEAGIAVLHCGWRGLLSGMVQAGARALEDTVLAAYVGPSVGPCCFPVDSDVARGFERRYGDGLVGEGGRLDLWEVAARALLETGVAPENQVNPRLCTFCNETYFYSHRRQNGRAGRQGAVAWEES